MSGFFLRRGCAGYTLLELVVASGIFAAVMVITVGAVLGIGNAQVKASNIQNIQDNLRFALESMTREMRTGSGFTLGGGAGCPPVCEEITFTAIRGGGTLPSEAVGYCFDAAAGEMRKFFPGNPPQDTCAGGVPLTDQTIVINQLLFYGVGTGATGIDGQARLSVLLRATSRSGGLPSVFRMQTTVTRRDRDQ